MAQDIPNVPVKITKVSEAMPPSFEYFRADNERRYGEFARFGPQWCNRHKGYSVMPIIYDNDQIDSWCMWCERFESGVGGHA